MVLLLVIRSLLWIIVACGHCSVLAGQDGFLASWFRRSDQAKADEPHWMTPLVTVTPRLEQEFRSDFLVQRTPGGNVVNFGNSATGKTVGGPAMSWTTLCR
jgi:hypothetical protein